MFMAVDCDFAAVPEWAPALGQDKIDKFLEDVLVKDLDFGVLDLVDVNLVV